LPWLLLIFTLHGVFTSQSETRLGHPPSLFYFYLFHNKEQQNL
jgi:hypothetical protein